jgi:hypothetical protein
MNPNLRDAQYIVNRKATAASSLKIHRETVALAPALAERLAKTKWPVGPSPLKRKILIAEQGEYDLPETDVRLLLASSAVALITSEGRSPHPCRG